MLVQRGGSGFVVILPQQRGPRHLPKQGNSHLPVKVTLAQEQQTSYGPLEGAVVRLSSVCSHKGKESHSGQKLLEEAPVSLSGSLLFLSHPFAK